MNYTAIDQILHTLEHALSPAEAHGIAVGMLCVDDKTRATAWLDEILPARHTLDNRATRVLTDCFEASRASLDDAAFVFDLLLPQASLAQRAEQLCAWCRGFLYGLGYQSSSLVWPGDSREILRDIQQISRLDCAIGDSDDEEADFTELHEYLRAAVMLIRIELRNARPTASLH